MKSKGFTLVELLAVIAILSILVIMAIPNVMRMFNNARKKSFDTELKTIYKQAKGDYMVSNGTKTKFCDSKTKEIKNDCEELNVNTQKEYYVELDNSGNVTYLGMQDDTFVYGADNIETIENIKEEDIKEKFELKTFTIRKKEVTKGNYQNNKDALKITLDNANYTNKGEATEELYLLKGEKVPKVRVLPKARYKVRINIEFTNNQREEYVESILTGWYTEKSSGEKVIDEVGNVIPNVEGYTDKDGKYIKSNNITLYSHWNNNYIIIPEDKCTSDIYKTPYWTGSYTYLNSNGSNISRSISEDLIPGSKYYVSSDTSLNKTCITKVKFTHINAGDDFPKTIEETFSERTEHIYYHIPKKENYDFEGWYIDSTFKNLLFDKRGNMISSVSGYSDRNGIWISSKSSVTLYAKWKIHTETVTFDGNKIEVPSGSALTFPSYLYYNSQVIIKFCSDVDNVCKDYSYEPDFYVIAYYDNNGNPYYRKIADGNGTPVKNVPNYINDKGVWIGGSTTIYLKYTKKYIGNHHTDCNISCNDGNDYIPDNQIIK